MRKNIVAGNWKMNTTLPEGVALAKEVNEALKGIDAKCDVIICTPFTHLASVAAVIDQNKLGLGAENCADHVKGAYTGEVSAPMVASTGATYVILGHSERRRVLRRDLGNPQNQSRPGSRRGSHPHILHWRETRRA